MNADQLKKLIDRLQVTIGDEDLSIRLDDLVHELKSKEASAINNGGVYEQVSYILEQQGEEGIRTLENFLAGPPL